jgi:hypothetical protein
LGGDLFLGKWEEYGLQNYCGENDGYAKVVAGDNIVKKYQGIVERLVDKDVKNLHHIF